MNKSATRDAHGTLIEPATLKIQRMLPHSAHQAAPVPTR